MWGDDGISLADVGLPDLSPVEHVVKHHFGIDEEMGRSLPFLRVDTVVAHPDLQSVVRVVLGVDQIHAQIPRGPSAGPVGESFGDVDLFARGVEPVSGFGGRQFSGDVPADRMMAWIGSRGCPGKYGPVRISGRGGNS